MIGAPGDAGTPGPAGVAGPPGPPGPPGDVSGALAGNFWDRMTAAGMQKGPRRWYGAHYTRYRRSVSFLLNKKSHKIYFLVNTVISFSSSFKIKPLYLWLEALNCGF